LADKAAACDLIAEGYLYEINKFFVSISFIGARCEPRTASTFSNYFSYG
jgi:hypothetical protein